MFRSRCCNPDAAPHLLWRDQGGEVYGPEVWRGIPPVHSGGTPVDIGRRHKLPEPTRVAWRKARPYNQGAGSGRSRLARCALTCWVVRATIAVCPSGSARRRAFSRVRFSLCLPWRSPCGSGTVPAAASRRSSARRSGCRSRTARRRAARSPSPTARSLRSARARGRPRRWRPSDAGTFGAPAGTAAARSRTSACVSVIGVIRYREPSGRRRAIKFPADLVGP